MDYKQTFLAITLLTGVAIAVLTYSCGIDFCLSQPAVIHIPESVTVKTSFVPNRQGMLPVNSFSDGDLNRSYNLNFDKKDVMVFIHIQKTGGSTFEHHLVKNIVKPACQCYKRKFLCNCFTQKKTMWLFSRFSTGWPCGVHVDWTGLQVCIDKAMNIFEKKSRTRRYHYMTFLRDPFKRFLSEWKHVKRGATWKKSKLFCNGRLPTEEEWTPCYNKNATWAGVTLDEFLHCDSNLARNRQTRMLANLTKINCYNSTGWNLDFRNQIMLQSAKDNLLNMDYFGLTEFQKYSQKLFEHVFNMKFKNDFILQKETTADETKIPKEYESVISEQIKLDIELYKYAKDLFLQRVIKMKKDLGDDSKMEMFSNLYK